MAGAWPQSSGGWDEPPVSEPEIKPARVEDLPAIRELAAIIWHAHYPGIISREQIDYMLARMYALETLRDEM